MKLDNANDINKVKETEALWILFPCEDKKKNPMDKNWRGLEPSRMKKEGPKFM